MKIILIWAMLIIFAAILAFISAAIMKHSTKELEDLRKASEELKSNVIESLIRPICEPIVRKLNNLLRKHKSSLTL